MKLVTWSLATFHATAFVLAIVLFAYSRDALGAGLSGLNTFVGLGLFMALWATTYLTTSQALKGLDLIGNTQHGLYLLEIVEAYPVGTDTLNPGSEDHILDGSTRIRDPKLAALLYADHNS